MNNFWNELVSSPYFGIALTFVAFEIGLWIRKKTKIALLLPFVLAIVIICSFLFVTGVSYEQYMEGAKYISFFMGPATVILAIPVYEQMEKLKKNLFPILMGILMGSFVSFFSTYLLSLLFKADHALFLTLIPHSVTTPIALSLTEKIGGVGSITTFSLIISGILGAAFAPALRRLFHLTDPVALGVATGTCSHVLGTAKAIERSEVEGAFSSLSIGIAGFVTVIIVPILLRFFYLA